METHLFQYFPEKDLRQLLDALHSCTRLYTQLLDEKGAPLFTFGDPEPYCRMSETCLPGGKTCREEHNKACFRSVGLGEPYIFCCHSGVYHITYPLLNKERLFGSVLLGPFLMDGTDDDLIKHLAKASEIPTDTVLELYKGAQSIPELSPEEVVKVSRLLYYLVNSLISGSRELQNASRERMLHHSRVSESIHRYKQMENQTRKDYPFEKERLLISEIRTGNREKAEAAFNDLLANIILYEEYDLSGVKSRLIELCALMSRASIERGAGVNLVLDLDQRLIQEIQNGRSINEISFLIQSNLEVFCDTLYFSAEKKNDTIRKATEYIHHHFSEKITLSELAGKLGITPPYLSMLFKRVTTLSFRDYLNQVRIEEAKRLLISTEYPIMEIAIACGFSEQSYFTNVFRKYTGMPPNQYR